MEQELVRYLLREHRHRLARFDSLAYAIGLDALDAANPDATQIEWWYKRTWPALHGYGWQPDAQAEQRLLAGDIDAFRCRIAQKLYDEHGGDALLNNCPRCHRLARTSHAKQCRHCGHDWH